MSLSPTYSRDLLWHRMEGVALCFNTLAAGLSEGGVYSAYIYLVGPPEDKLQLWLQLSSFPGWTHPRSKGGPIFVIRAQGLYLQRGGVVVVIIIHLEWGRLRHQVLFLDRAIH
jgi:hypothetical protein